ncbi:MAG: PilC/PilY family type IV pilus protein [Oleibacter sp.]|nr:PilC/PilY family type IV pilus protein [Thalassolituus sp.]
MFNRIKNNMTIHFLTAFIIVIAGTAHADDIDVYAVNQNQNLLFVFDTSLSMGNLEYYQPGAVYDPNFEYPMSSNGYDPDSIYINKEGFLSKITDAINGSGSSLDGRGSTDTEINSIKVARISRENVMCSQILNEIDEFGVYNSKNGNTRWNDDKDGRFSIWDRSQNKWYAPGGLGELISNVGSLLSTATGIELFQKLLGINPAPNDIVACAGGDSPTNSNYVSPSNSYSKRRNGSSGPFSNSGSAYQDETRFLFPRYFDLAWSGNYLNYQIARREILNFTLSNRTSRLGLSRAALINSIKNLEEPEKIQMGLMRFDIRNTDTKSGDGTNGGFVSVPVEPLSDNHEYMRNKLNRYHPAGNTPLSETMYEAYLYLSGRPVKYGLNSDSYWLRLEENINTIFGGTPVNDQPLENLLGAVGLLAPGEAVNEIPSPSVKSRDVTDISDFKTTESKNYALDETVYGIGDASGLNTAPNREDNYYAHDTYYSTGESYNAPDLGECGNTQLVLFTDGLPTDDSNANNLIKSLITSSGLTLPSGMSANCSGDGGCADELAYVMANYDIDLDPADDSKALNVTTHVVGGFINNGSTVNYLTQLANAGGGSYYNARNYEELEGVFTDILNGFAGSTTTFSSPGLSLSSTNRLSLSDELYFALFSPETSQNWRGNLKRYRIDESGTIVDSKDNSAVDSNGAFISTSQSFWAEQADGDNVADGGIANLLNLGNRKIFMSDTDDDNIDVPLLDISIRPVSIGNAVANISTLLDSLNINNNANFSDILSNSTGLLGIDSNINPNELIAWIGGVNQDGTARLEMEDPLHSSPVMLRYKDTSDNVDRAIFVGTNSGYLHSFNPDVDPGTSTSTPEYFSFIPRELLRNASYYFSGANFLSNKKYGVDGPLTSFHKDTNRDGFINNGEKAYIYMTLRRGGQSIYALDVSDINQPKLAWQIHGDYSQLNWNDNQVTTPKDIVNIPAKSTGFDLLGQSWSAMEPSEIRWKGERKFVLFMGGGYDTAYDTDQNATAKVGNTVYMIDAETGDMLWDANEHAILTNSQDQNMDASFAAPVVPIDRDGNSLTDMLYAVDVTGRVWRFDLAEQSSDSDTVASFAQGGVVADINSDGGKRMVYNKPDITLLSRNGQQTIAIGIGSGWRANPKFDNSATADKDYYFLVKDKNGKGVPTFGVNGTYQLTSFADLAEWGTPDASDATKNASGWKIPLEPNERILSPSVTYQGNVFFTTYTSPNQLVNCTQRLGIGQLYEINLYDTDPSNSVYGPSDILKPVSGCCGEGIPSEPSIPIFPATSAGNGGGAAANCANSFASVIVGTQAVQTSLNSCSLSDRNYWREDLSR